MSNSDDLRLAMWLLCGIRPDIAKAAEAKLRKGAPDQAANELSDREPIAEGLMIVGDYEPDYPQAADERKARQAVARVLKTDSPGRDLVIDALAALFDPGKTTHPFAKKIIELKHRGEGMPAKENRNDAICMAIEGLHQHAGLSYEQAYKRIAKSYGRSVLTVKDMFLDWRKARRKN
jgi:hypothetical protein